MKRRFDILFISSAGGHLTQLLRFQKEYDGGNTLLITEFTPSTKGLTDSLGSKVLFLPHGGREAPISFAWKFSLNLLVSFFRMLKYRPRVVISTGAHTAVPSVIFAKAFGAKVIYIESFARIRSPSLTGRILYPISDKFYVQWPELLSFYKHARYEGKLY